MFVVGPPAVSSGSAVAPSGLSVGDKFRLLFLSSTTRDATSSDIADYNTHVQTAAASGHAAIRAFSSSFLAVASTASDDARDNTSTTYTATDTGLPIYWLGGNKAADDYQDFYDGSWDDEANAKDESGNARSISATDRPWTGSDHDGTVVSVAGQSNALGGPDINFAAIGWPNDALSSSGPLFGAGNAAKSDSRPLYGLSPVLVVMAPSALGITPPDAPTGLTATAGDRQVGLTWTAPASDGGDEISYYEYEVNGSGTWISTGGTTVTHMVTGLTHQPYTFRVRAVNSAGGSAPSAASGSVTPNDMPGAPTGLTGTGGDEEVTLMWTAPASNGGLTITGYEYERTGSGTWTSTGSTDTNHKVTGLTNGQPYTYRVRALNRLGAGAASTASTSVTPTATPTVSGVALTSAPGTDNTYAIGDAVEATVTFDAAVDISGSPQLELDFAGTAKAAGCATGTNTTTMACSYTVLVGEEAPNGVAIAENKLTGGTIYATGTTTSADLDHVAVAIDAGHKVDGIRPTLVTTGTNAPTTSTDGTKVILIFSETISSVTRSLITIQADSVTQSTSAASVVGTKVELTLTTALTDTTATLTVELAADAVEDTATNGNLALAATAVTNAVGANEPPEFSPTTATREVPENTAANTNIGTALPAATDADNDPLTYTLEDTDAASFDFNATTRQLSTKSGVTYDHETKPSYSVTLKAEDGNGGSGTLAVTITVTDVEEPPGRPAAPSVSAAAGTTDSLEVNWTAPSNSGPDIDDYDLRYREGSSGSWTDGPQNVSGASATISGLTESTSYQVQVLARNAEGDSPWSLPGSGQTGALGPPEVPQSLTATPGNRKVRLTWTQPSGGAAVTHYEYELDASDTWTSTGSAETNYTVMELTNGQSYAFRVRAANSDGQSSPSTSVSATPAPTAPEAPQSLGATPGNKKVELRWTEPADDGGEPITRYEYEQDVSGTWTSTGSAETNYTVMELTNGQSYTFRVRAVNSIGGGAPTPSLSATPAPTEPDAPESLEATAGDGKVTLRWTAPPDDGGDSVTHYEYEQDGSGTWISTGSAETTHTVTGLVNGQSYTFRVRAVNGRGYGDVVTIEATPSRSTGGGGGRRTTAPRPPRNLTAAATDGAVTLTWDAPTGTGGAVITDYEYQIDGEGEWISIGSVKRMHTITGLAGGTVHVFRVRAVNRVGAGRASDPAEVTLPVLVVLDFTHFANGGGITSEMVLLSVAAHPIRPALYFYDRQGLLIDPASVVDVTMDLEVTESGSLTVRTGMEPLGVLTIATHGRGELVSGSVAVVSDGPLGGGVRYTVPHAGVTGVGASPPVGDVVFPARRRQGGIRTAASLHNLEEEAVEVSCRLMSGGVALEEVEISLEANGQSSWFIEDAFPMTDTSDFLGSVRCTAAGGREFTAIAIETDAAEGIYTTLPVVEVDRTGGRGGETVLDFAHLANGNWITELVFVNLSILPSRPALIPFDSPILPSRPAIYFYDTEGNPIAPGSLVDLTSGLEVTDDGALTVSAAMKPLGQLTIPTHGRGELVTGSVRVVSEGPIGGMLRFEHSAYGAAGVGPGLPLSEAVFPVWRREGGITSGFALHNLEEEAAEVTCDLMREGGVLDTVSLPLEANGQTSWTIQDAFRMTDTSDFAGAVRCSAGGGLFTALALEMDSGAPLITALPVVAVEERRYRERSVAENSPAGTDVGAPVAATDPDGGDTLTYSLAGVDAESFTIVASSGQIRTRSGVSYDHETRARYAVEVSVTDGTDSALVVIRVADVDEQPETPAAPEVEADAEAAGSLEVSWTEPGRSGGPKLKGYRLRYRKSAGRSWTELEETVAGTSATISALDAGTIYQVQVQALNGETPSEWSPSGTGSTGNKPPELGAGAGTP